MNSKRPLIWIAILSIAPFVASSAFYFWMKPNAQINYGTLLPPRPPLDAAGLHGLAGEPLAGNPLRGKWTLLTVDAAACAEACAKKLYATRQARTMQGKERERVVRLWLVAGGGSPPAELAPAHPDLQIGRADSGWLAALSGAPASSQEDGIFLVDPLGNLVLRYPADPDIKKLNKDLARLLYASRIG